MNVAEMKDSEILIAARDLLLTKGWAQGASTKNGYCSSLCVKAIVEQDQGLSGWSVHQDFIKHWNRALAYVQRCAGVLCYEDLLVWNDDPVRTKEEVLAVFDKAIVEAQQKEAA